MGINPRTFKGTYGELIALARGKDSAQWNHTAAIIATLNNVNAAKGQKRITPDEIHPYKKQGGGQHRIKLTRDNLHILKHAIRR